MGFPESNQPRKKGGAFVLLMFAVIAFFWMTRNAQRPRPNNQNDQGNNQSSVELDANEGLANKPELRSQNKTQNGDWGMQEVSTQTNSKSKVPTPVDDPFVDDVSPKQDKTQNGDWGAEDVATKSNSAKLGLKNKPLGKTQPSGIGNQTQNGDWGMQEVKPKKKVQKGDWGLEEVDSKKKKK